MAKETSTRNTQPIIAARLTGINQERFAGRNKIMNQELMKLTPETMSKLALNGDVAGLNPQEKVQYYGALCQRVGLDPATQPFKLMKLNGKEVFYLDRSGAQQLNRVHQISHEIKSREFANGCYVVTARASIGSRFTDSLGSVGCEGLKGEALANATMKAETKAKRRATLDLVGLGMLDEMEVESIPNAIKSDAPAVLMPTQPQIAPEAKKTTPAKPPKPIGELRALMIQRLLETFSGDMIQEYCVKAGILLSTEVLADIPDKYVAKNKSDLEQWKEAITNFGNGAAAEKPFDDINV